MRTRNLGIAVLAMSIAPVSLAIDDHLLLSEAVVTPTVREYLPGVSAILPASVPTVSEWGLLALGVSLMSGLALVVKRACA